MSMNESDLVTYAPWEAGPIGKTVSQSSCIPVDKPLGTDCINPNLPGKSRSDADFLPKEELE